ncbi:NACHT domain-and WD repeat-containing protein 1 [Trichonephila clavipes]|nr:NACHT domain-and WD repeat-containing protein 1 [Trichonephila clavipes]
MLDWEVELLYSMTKQSVDVLSQDPQQLATEIINWLRPFLNGTTKIMDQLVTHAREWCNNNIIPLLVPQNNWLNLALPPQVTMMTCSQPITHMISTPDSQHVMGCSQETNIEMYHLPSRNLVRVLTGNSKAALRVYEGRFPSRRMLNHKMFLRLHRQQCENGRLMASTDAKGRSRTVQQTHLK